MADTLSQFTVMRTLVRREFWEQRVLFLYLPAVLTLVLLGTILLRAMRYWQPEFVPDYSTILIAGEAPTPEFINIMETGFRASMLRSIYRSGTEMHALVFSLAAVYYCLSTLFKQRRSRHALFFSSMPVSERQTVLSKALSGLVLTHGVYLLWALLMMVVLLAARTLHASLAGIDMGSEFLSPAPPSAGLVNGMLLSILSLLWCLPGFAWLLFCSAWAKQAPLAWAAAPFVAISLPSLLIFNNTDLPLAIASHFVPFFLLDWGNYLDASRAMQNLGWDNLLLSVVVGLGLLFAAIKFNRTDAD